MLLQVRLFVAEEAPGMSGSGAQDHLQAKPTRNLHIFNPSVPAPAPDAPPGFGGVLVKSQSDQMAAAAVVPQISWRLPNTVSAYLEINGLGFFLFRTVIL